MRTSSSLLLCCCFGLILTTPAAVRGQGKKAESVTITTGDYAEIKGYWYRGDKGKESPTVLIMHRLGGHCREDGLEALAEALNKKGFAVLAMDFRGHGRSTGINSAKFWNFAHNQTGYIRTFRAGVTKQPETIEQGDFTPMYLPYLINDIYAAKMFLDNRNDKSECNSGQLILIGAEEGATLGLMYVAAEFERFKYTPRTNAFDTIPESRDILCCVWLSLSPKLGSKAAMPVNGWLKMASSHKENKIPMAFVFGADDKTGDSYALQWTRALKPGYDRDKAIKNDKLAATGDFGVPKSEKLEGSKLLNKDLETEKWIVDKYLLGTVFKKKDKGTDYELNKAVERFTSKDLTFDWMERDLGNKVFMFKPGSGRPFDAKLPLEKTMVPVSPNKLGLLN